MKEIEISKEYCRLKREYLEALHKYNRLRRDKNSNPEDVLDALQDYTIKNTRFIDFKDKYGHLVILEK